ncbi:MAG: PG0541 family transporter-associated protein [Thermoanaerobaculaceae bacterium]
MKMLMIVVDESKKEQLEVLLNKIGVEGYTEIPRVVGVGTTGPRLGSRAFPKTSALIFSVLTQETFTKLVSAIEEFCKSCGEKLKLIWWDVEEVRL